MPKRRSVDYADKPPEIPQNVYTEACSAKKFYNEEWEFWVWQEAQNYNKPIPEVEDACIRGIKKAILRTYFVHGDKIGRWYEDFLDMSDIFNKVSHPIYLKQL